MIQVAIMGFGVVGSGVAKIIEENQALLAARLSDEITVKYILDIRDFTGHALAGRVVRDFSVIENDPEVSVVVEAMGGVHPAYDYSLKAIRAKKSVVTSNKELVSLHGRELLEEAKENGVRYLFEASVGGGIPIIRPLSDCLAANEISSVTGIMNGTTNYILTQMEENGAPFADALSDAQARGFAERDPSADIDGKDTCRKLCILADIAFGYQVNPDLVTCEGIRAISPRDISDAAEAGYCIKLLGHVRRDDEGITPIVAPFLLSRTHILSGVSGVFNGIGVVGNMVGETMFYGHGAGSAPTASAMVGDIIEACEVPSSPVLWKESAPEGYIKDVSACAFARYLRVKGTRADSLTVLAECAVRAVSNGDETGFFLPAMTDEELAVILKMIPELTVTSSLRIFTPGEFVPKNG
ncbi:MAG: homoserine dehydrogenase [Clostridia bacterium]|nr:homoserine dehydrogenase [Clostridia bacterium]